MLSARRSRFLTPISALGALAASALLGACGGTGGASGTAAKSAVVGVAAGDRSCELDRSELAAGTATFAITNTGEQTTEVYVYAPDDGGDYTAVLTEVENIGPGLSRTMEAQLVPGTYEVACKPGQSGEGIRTTLTVQGNGGPGEDGAKSEESAADEAEVAYDREVELETDGTSLTVQSGADLRANAGEKVEFKIENKAPGPITLELKAADGDVVGKVEAIKPGGSGELVAALDEAGQWQLVIERDGYQDIVDPLWVS